VFSILNYKAISKNRQKLGLSQQELAEKTGMRAEQISRIENGKLMNPTLRTLELLSTALEISVIKLIDDTKVTI
jgi:transcriptional regulator with XRE-family HTH domain